MAEILEADNLTKYKSYIQRRRAGSAPSVTGSVFAETEKKTSDISDEVSSAQANPESLGGFFYNQYIHEKKSAEDSDPIKESASTPDSRHSGHARYSHRTDTAGIYRRLYGKGYKNIGSPSYSSSYNSSVYNNRAAIEDNRATVLAIKIIKQALACFAILGIIVLLQQRDDTAGVLAFIKKHIVDNHIDSKSLWTGVEDLVSRCTNFLGGSP